MENLPEQNRALDEARDAKGSRIARAFLESIRNGMIMEDANEIVDFNPLVKEMLSTALNEDANTVTELPYAIQLVLTQFAGLNAMAQKVTAKRIDDVRYGKIAQGVLDILADANIEMGPTRESDYAEHFASIRQPLQDLLDGENLSTMELKYVMDTIFESFRTVSNMFNMSIERNTEKAEAKLFGIETMNDLTLRRLDEVLKQ